MPTLAELSTFSALPQGQQTILRIAARINEVLRRCHQQGVEPSPAVLWHIEDALDTALELGMDNPILWPHPVITEVATVIYGKSTPRLGDVNLRRIAIDCVANECKGQTVPSGRGLTLSLVTLSKIKRCRVQIFQCLPWIISSIKLPLRMGRLRRSPWKNMTQPYHFCMP
ncbi:hypothetical protein BC834DRAFT_1037077 [Gloeopeniophorella convolvens]|nr:hypothetical protein BC834DRAFT_1037077 [Gloeopeniophorella convolvens]